MKNLTNLCPESKKWSNNKMKAHHNDFDKSNSPYNDIIIRKCLYFVNLKTFYILGQKFVKFFVFFFGKSMTPKRHSKIN